MPQPCVSSRVLALPSPTHPHESQRYVPYMTVRKFEHIRKLSGPCPLRRTTDIAPNRNHNAGDHSLRKQPNLRTVGSEKDRTLPTSGSSSISVLCSHSSAKSTVGMRWYAMVREGTRRYPSRVLHTGYLHLKFELFPFQSSHSDTRWYGRVLIGQRTEAWRVVN